MSRADRMMIQVPASDVSRGEPLRKSAQIAVLDGPQDQMPMIGHQTIAENPHEDLLLRLGQHLFEGRIIRVPAKNLTPRVSSIENVENHSARRIECSSWHTLQRILASRAFQYLIELIRVSRS